MKKNITILMFLFGGAGTFLPCRLMRQKQVNDMSDINLTVFRPVRCGRKLENLWTLSGPLAHVDHLYHQRQQTLVEKTHFQPQGISGIGENHR